MVYKQISLKRHKMQIAASLGWQNSISLKSGNTFPIIMVCRVFKQNQQESVPLSRVQDLYIS